MSLSPLPTRRNLGERAFLHLQHVVAIDSQSDEFSTTLPTTEGQRRLAGELQAFFGHLGADVHLDRFSTVVASFPGRGGRAALPPVAFLVHIDTARGTAATSSLHRLPAWDGSPIPYPANPALRVGTETYPAVAPFLGHEIVFGDGTAPFGLDDKLGLAEMMALAELVAGDERIEHPPLIFVGRPDEEVGRDEALVEVADLLAARGVRHAFTIDGILPFEVNVENFHAAMASLWFVDGEDLGDGIDLAVFLGGVNTHGATAAAEGHRAGPRLAAEWAARCPELRVLSFRSDESRDCDAHLWVRVPEEREGHARACLGEVMAEHLPRGASFRVERGQSDAPGTAADSMIRWLQRFYASAPGFTLPCEDSEGRDGYSHPMRARADEKGLRLDIRVRDFDREGLDRRLAHLKALWPEVRIVEQYRNMADRLLPYPELVRWANEAGADVGRRPLLVPIRGGTGIGPFVDRGTGVANLGTGYFSPESEKEITSIEGMADHVAWLFALVQRLGT